MSEEKKYSIKELEEKLDKVKETIYENLRKYGHFDITLNDGTFIVGHNVTVNWCCDEPRLMIETALYEVYAIVPVKSIRYIGVSVPVNLINKESDKNERKGYTDA